MPPGTFSYVNSMPTNAAQFIEELRAFEEVIREEGVTLQRKVGRAVIASLVRKTPVRTGQARANWQVTLGAPATGVVDEVDPTGEATIAAGNRVLRSMRLGDTMHFTNNLDYIQKLEEGSSDQAPAGMVAVTLAEVELLIP